MTDLRTAAQQALEAIDYLDSHPEGGIDEAETAIEALRAALAQPEPAAPTEPAPGWCKHCQQYTIAEPLPAAPTVVEPVAHCALTPAGKIAHFDGRPMVMIGSVGNEHHPTPLYAAAPPRAALTDERPYTYASTQATNCAGCGEYKHTPLRIDAMDGYVCLTCIDKKLGTLLGEFGCPAPQSPLSEEDITSEYFASQLTTKDSVESVFAAGVRWAEKAHGIAHGISADRGEKK
jgi:hypothetical protein